MPDHNYMVLITMALQKVFKFGRVSFSILFLFRGILSILGPMNLNLNFRISLSPSSTNPIGIIIEILLDSTSINIFMTVSLSLHECELSFHLFSSYLVSPNTV